MMQDAGELSSIAMFGASEEVWPIAAILSESLPNHIQLIVCEELSLPPGACANSLPWGHRFQRSIGVQREEFVSHCDATFGLGTHCQEWPSSGGDFFLAQSGSLPLINGFPLFQILLKAASERGQAENLAELYAPFRFCARAAKAGKFSEPSAGDQSPTAMLAPTVQFDRSLFTTLLKKKAKKKNVRSIETQVIRAVECNNLGNIISVQLKEGRKIDAHFFIDLSGTISNLISKESRPPRKAHNPLTPFDRIMVAKKPKQSIEAMRHCVARAKQAGLIIQTPLQSGVANEFLFSSSVLSDDSAATLFGEIKSVRAFHSGFLESPWTYNLLRLGTASANLGPFLSADMLLLCEQAVLLTSLLPARRTMRAEAVAFNSAYRNIISELSDFTSLPFVLNGRNEPTWRACRDAAVSESLAFRLNQFSARGRFAPYDREIFDSQNWIDTMIGFGLVPKRYDPLVDSLEMRHVGSALQGIMGQMENALSGMQDHDYFMRGSISKLTSV